jgi:predicted AAA+ superfamily ATPase
MINEGMLFSLLDTITDAHALNFEYLSKVAYLSEFRTVGLSCPRQQGKTTALKNVAQILHDAGNVV